MENEYLVPAWAPRDTTAEYDDDDSPYEEAVSQAETIALAWESCGARDVRVWIEELWLGKTVTYCIRSNLVCGLPPSWHAELSANKGVAGCAV